MKFLNNEQRTLTYSKLEKLAEATPVDEDETHESDNELEEPTTKKSKTESAIEYLLGNSLGRSSDTRSPHDEMDVFVTEPAADPNTDPLKWCKLNHHRFLILSKVAKQLLCIPATSVPSERIFSTSDLIINNKKAHLKPKNVDMLVFLNKNLPVIKK